MQTNGLAIHAASSVLKLNGRTYKLDFDLGALAAAERVYRRHFGQSATTYDIISEIFEAQTSAIMALAYGALCSAGEKLAWEHFAKDIFTFDNFDAIAEAVADAVGEMFGDGDEAAAEDDPKNASSRGAR